MNKTGPRREGILPSLAPIGAFRQVCDSVRLTARQGRQNAVPPRARPSSKSDRVQAHHSVAGIWGEGILLSHSPQGPLLRRGEAHVRIETPRFNRKRPTTRVSPTEGREQPIGSSRGLLCSGSARSHRRTPRQAQGLGSLVRTSLLAGADPKGEVRRYLGLGSSTPQKAKGIHAHQRRLQRSVEHFGRQTYWVGRDRRQKLVLAKLAEDQLQVTSNLTRYG